MLVVLQCPVDEVSRCDDRLTATTISAPTTESILGELASLSKYGKMELEIDGEKIKASFPIEMLSEIQKKKIRLGNSY